MNTNKTVLDNASLRTGLRFNKRKTKVQSVSHHDQKGKTDLSQLMSDPSEDFISSVVDSESIYKHMTAEDAKIANRLLAKNTILQQKCPDQISEFLATKGSGDDLYSLPERLAKDNQAQYLEKYSVNVELPSMYVIDTQINPLFPDYCIQLVKFVIPEVEHLLVNANMQDGSQHVSSFNKIYGKYKKGLVLRLLQRQGQQLFQIREHVLNGIWHAFLKISNCGTLLSIFIP